MNKTVLIVGSKDKGSKNDPQMIADSLSASTVARVAYWEDLIFHIAANGKVRVEDYQGSVVSPHPDTVILLGWYKNGKNSIYRDIAYSFALYAESLNIPIWNSEALSQRSTSKASCMVQLALHGIPIPQTVFSLNNGSIAPWGSLPCVVKAAATSRGKKNLLISDKAALMEALASDELLLRQDYLENDHDLRVICFAAEPALVLKRSRSEDSGTHINNTSHGGHGQWIEVSDMPNKILTTCREICKIMKRELAGIDLIPDPRSPIGYSVLEVNSIPQLTSGFDVDKKLDAFVRSIS